MKKEYKKPLVEVIVLEHDEIIVTSIGDMSDKLDPEILFGDSEN